MSNNLYRNNIITGQDYKPLLHKKGKQWIVVGLSSLLLAGMGVVTDTATHADATNNNTNSSQVSALQTKVNANNPNVDASKVSTKNIQPSNNGDEYQQKNANKLGQQRQVGSSNISQQAGNLHSALVYKNTQLQQQSINSQTPTSAKPIGVKKFNANKSNLDSANSSSASSRVANSNVVARITPKAIKSVSKNNIKNNQSASKRINKPIMKVSLEHNIGDSNDAQAKASDDHWIYDNGKFISSMPSTDTISDGTYDGLTYKYDATLQALKFTGGKLDWNNLNDSLLSTFLQDFPDFSSIASIKFDNNVNTSNVTGMVGMFCNLQNLESLDLGNKFNTSKVTDMSNMFSDDSSLHSLTLPDSFDTSNVTNMGNMFDNDTALQSLTLPDSFDTSNVTNMSDMFFDDSALQTLTLPSTFDTHNVTNMTQMFSSDTALQTLTLPDSFDTSNVTNMGYMFDNDTALQSLTLPDSFDTSNVTNMIQMFSGDKALQSLNLGNKFNTSKVTDMGDMFSSDTALQSLTFGSHFDTSNVLNQHKDSYIFGGDSPTSVTIKSPKTKFDNANGNLFLYKKDTNDNFTSQLMNDFSQGNVGTFINSCNIPTDTINYINSNGKKLASQTFTATQSDYNGNGYNDIVINSFNIPQILKGKGYHILNNHNFIPYDGKTHNIKLILPPKPKEDAVSFHDIYSDIDRLKAPETEKIPMGKTIYVPGEIALHRSDISSGWAPVDNNGHIITDPEAESSNQVVNIAPVYDGFTFKYNKATQSIEFTDGAPNGYFMSDPVFIGGSDKIRIEPGINTQSIKDVRFDSDTNTNSLPIAVAMFSRASNLQSIELPNNFGEGIQLGADMFLSNPKLKTITISSGFGKSMNTPMNMMNMFAGDKNLQSFILNNPSTFGAEFKKLLTDPSSIYAIQKSRYPRYDFAHHRITYPERIIRNHAPFQHLYRVLPKKDAKGDNYTTKAVDFTKGTPQSGTYVFKGNFMPSDTTDTIIFTNQNNTNLGTTTSTGTPNNTFTINNVPAGYHIDTTKNPSTLTYDGNSHKVYIMGNQIKGTAMVHLVYKETNGTVDHTKDVQVPINAHVGDNNMVITPWSYFKDNYNVPMTTFTIPFNASVAQSGSNLNYNPSDTFTFTGQTAGDLTVQYVDTDAGAQAIDGEQTDSQGQPIVGSQDLGSLGVAGETVELGAKGANNGNNVKDLLQVPNNWDLVHAINTIQVQLHNKPVHLTLMLSMAEPSFIKHKKAVAPKAKVVKPTAKSGSAADHDKSKVANKPLPSSTATSASSKATVASSSASQVQPASSNASSVVSNQAHNTSKASSAVDNENEKPASAEQESSNSVNSKVSNVSNALSTLAQSDSISSNNNTSLKPAMNHQASHATTLHKLLQDTKNLRHQNNNMIKFIQNSQSNKHAVRANVTAKAEPIKHNDKAIAEKGSNVQSNAPLTVSDTVHAKAIAKPATQNNTQKLPQTNETSASNVAISALVISLLGLGLAGVDLEKKHNE